MRTIDDYIDAAKKVSGIKSDRTLGVHLGLNPTSISQYRTRRTWPHDEVMFRLAETAGLDPQEALLELAFWRCSHRQENRAASVFKALIERNFHAAIMGAVMAGSLLISNGNAEAAPLTQKLQANPTSLYYGKFFTYLCNRFRRLRSRNAIQLLRNPYFKMFSRLSRFEELQSA